MPPGLGFEFLHDDRHALRSEHWVKCSRSVQAFHMRSRDTANSREMMKRLRLQARQKFGRALKRLLAALDRAELLHDKIAVGRRGEQHPPVSRVLFSSTVSNVHVAVKRCARSVLASAAVRIRHTLERDDFLERAFVRVIRAVGAMQRLLPHAADAEIVFLDRRREAARAAPPL